VNEVIERTTTVVTRPAVTPSLQLLG